MRLIRLEHAMLGAATIALLAGLVPAGVALDHLIVSALETRAREDLALAPRILEDRRVASADALMMRAKEIAQLPGLAAALAGGDRDAAVALVGRELGALGGEPVLVGADRESWRGPPVAASLVERTRSGEMPVSVDRADTVIRTVALAPVLLDGRWVGAAGLVVPMDQRAVESLEGLTRSHVAVLTADDRIAIATLDEASTRSIAIAFTNPEPRGVRVLTAEGRQLLAIGAPLGDAGTVVFARALDEELAILPRLRRIALGCALAALLLVAAVGTLLASRLARPVRELAGAAEAVGRGDFDAPIPASRLREAALLGGAFQAMRRTLAGRLAELRAANAALSDWNARLTALQSDLMRRDRLATTGRLVTQLAHEIRNPIASLRNCLELVRRRVTDDAEAREFTELAIDELLRMHELSERMLDLYRPSDPRAMRCRPVFVARDVARLVSTGVSDGTLQLHVDGDPTADAIMAPDALKQVLLNLVQNSREAVAAHASPGEDSRPLQVRITTLRTETRVVIEVVDDGPGIAPELRERIFDPFFTTKSAVRGVGLGLFVAEGLVRAAGGSLSLADEAGPGACFRIELDAGVAPAPSDHRLVDGGSSADRAASSAPASGDESR